MNISTPSRRLLASLRQRPPSQCHRLVPIRQQRRPKSDSEGPKNSEKTTVSTTSKGGDQVASLSSGKLGPSIFDSIPEAAQKEQGNEADEGQAEPEEGQKPRTYEGEDVPSETAKPQLIGRDLRPTFRNPNPKAIIRWKRKQVIQDVRGRHRLNNAEKLLRTERFHSAKSPFIKTSIKKLGPLARQIAGKTVEEAMVQMRFSKKKAAQDVLKHLKYVRDQAVVAKGMGLGKDIGAGIDRPPPNELEAKLKREGRVVVEDKEGKRRTVTDRSAMYIDQAWVGRGTYGFGTDYRARGQGHRLRLPHTSISIVLKEEATRMRLQEEREQKRLKKAVWVPLPDRPITAQRQYPLW